MPSRVYNTMTKILDENADFRHISNLDFNLLQTLGILDASGAVTPEAYCGYISRLKLNEQAQALGLPLIITPPPFKNSNPEVKISKFLSNDKSLYVDSGFQESYLVRNFLSAFSPLFDFFKRNHELSDVEIHKVVSTIEKIDNAGILKLIEQQYFSNIHFGFAYGIRATRTLVSENISIDYLKSRFKLAECYLFHEPSINNLESDKGECLSYLKSKVRAKQYADNMMKNIILWKSLPAATWADLYRICAENWPKMSTGWPDINCLSESNGLFLVEVKGKDKLHNSQIFTLGKLREVLGPERIAIAWANRIAYDLPQLNSDHQISVWNWINTKTDSRVNDIEHPLFFYDKEKCIFYEK